MNSENPENPAHPIYELHNGALKQVSIHGLQYAIVYLCDEHGIRALQIIIKPGESKTLGDHRFCFESLKKGVVYSAYEEHDRSRFKAIESSLV